MGESYALSVVAAEETFLLQMAEKALQLVPESFHAVHDDPFVVIGKRTLSCDGEHLVEGTDATWQCDEHIAVLCNELFALRECRTEIALMVDGIGMLVFQQECRHHTHHPSAIVSHSVCDAVHQSEVSSSIY